MALFIIALLLMPVTAFLFGQFWLGMTFSVFYVCFGIIEVVAKAKSGSTVSQHVWKLPMGKRWIVIAAMIAGWSALILHFLKIL
ncbi:MAG: hypothetical protein KKB31_07430 [Nanoarchaeota archaeon]|nr:hypothetical protein [Nanoarchaeota archaeon]